MLRGILFFSFGASIGIILGNIIISLKNKERIFRCDVCGRRYAVEREGYYIENNNMMCARCYNSTKAPYKIEREER